jgi:GAF domain-containing protein
MTDPKLQSKAVHAREKALEQLGAIARSTAARPARAREAAELIRGARHYHWVGLYEVSLAEIFAIAWTGPNAPAFPRFPIRQGLNGAAVQARRNVIVQDVTRDPRYLTTFGSTRAEAIFVIASPAGRIVGTLDVESDRPNAFTAEDEDFLSRCAAALRPLWPPV